MQCGTVVTATSPPRHHDSNYGVFERFVLGISCWQNTKDPGRCDRQSVVNWQTRHAQYLEHTQGTAGEAHPPPCQLPQGGCKTPAGAVRAAVLAAPVHSRKAVQQIVPWNAHIGEAHGAIVHPLQSHLHTAMATCSVLLVHVLNNCCRLGCWFDGGTGWHCCVTVWKIEVYGIHIHV